MTASTWRPSWRRRTPEEKRAAAERRCERRARRQAQEAIDVLEAQGVAVDPAAIVDLYEGLLDEELDRLEERRLS